ncbi:MAG: O-antigen ligase family protein, partial [Clostridia bacterium]|nr:O-antigen ligase family protein [Clostridia bacterium]
LLGLFFDFNKIQLVLSAGLLILSILFMTTKASFSSLLQTSFFLQKFQNRIYAETITLPYKQIVLWGIIFGIVSAFSGILPVLVLFFMFIGVCFAVKNISLSLLLYITVLPFMPTMVMVAGAIALCLILGVKTHLFRERIDFSGTSLNFFVFLMMAMLSWGVVNSYDKLSSLKSVMVYIAFMLVYYLIVRLINSKEKLVKAFSLLTVASLVCSLYGIYQYFNPAELQVWQDSEMFSEISGRIVSFFENPNVYGEYLILIIMINVALFATLKRPLLKICTLILLALSGLCMILTYSRGCWIGIALAVALFLFIYSKKVFLLFAVLGVVGLFFLPESVMTRLLSIGNLADSSTSYRVYIWQGTMNMLKDFWVTGIGVGTSAFNHVYPIYAFGAISAPHPHNLYLLLLSEMGILGLLVFVVLMIMMLKKLFVTANKSKDKTISAYSAALFSALVGFLVQGIFDNVWYNYRVFLLFWIIVGLSGAVCLIHKKMEDKKC